jgi:mono/diheme cytochrome c family protein
VKRALKWVGVVLGSLVVAVLVVVFVVSEYRLRQKFDIAAPAIVIPTDSVALARGRYLSVTRGCGGCHGPGLRGQVFLDEPMLVRLIAPNVSKLVRGYSDPELARLLRHGVRPDGRGVAVMPSSMLYHLDDADLGALVAYLRTLPEREPEKPLPATSMRLLARAGLAIGKFKLEPLMIDHTAPRASNGPDAAERGRYVAMSTCTECHGLNLEGREDRPALSIVAGYSSPEFFRLMREGVPKDGRKLGLMGEVIRSRFVHLTDEEVAALYAYLSRAGAPGAKVSQR